MENKTSLYYKDIKGDLRTLSYGDSEYDINSVNDQGQLVADIIEMQLTTPRSIVLCCIESVK
tara:strand:+ start:4493 stop:4678 length:186 start_codon:yes stop_codon:yes gene_type:complete